MKNCQAAVKSAKEEVARLQKFLNTSVDAKGVELDGEIHNDLIKIMQEHSSEVEKAFLNSTLLAAADGSCTQKNSQTNEMASANDPMVLVTKATVIIGVRGHV